MRLSLVCAWGVAALALSLKGQTLQMNDSIPHAAGVCVSSLPNGIQLYVQENETPAHCGSFRVVLRKSGHEEVLLVYDGQTKTADAVEEFFAFCVEKANASLGGMPQEMDRCHFKCSTLPVLGEKEVEEMAVIAVGDFSLPQMQEMIQEHFASIALSGQSEAAPLRSIHVKRDRGLRKVALKITQSSLQHPVNTYADLKEKWKCFLMQDLFQNRLERCARYQQEGWIHPHSRFFYPVSGYALASEEISENLLSFLLWQVETIRNEGFSDEEFFIAKRNALRNIQYLNACAAHPDSSYLASYYADQFLLGKGCYSHNAFFGASEEFIDHLELEDLTPYIDPFLNHERQSIQVVYPVYAQERVMTEEKIAKIADRISALASFYSEANDNEEEESDWVFDTSVTHSLAPHAAAPQMRRVHQIDPVEFSLAGNIPLKLVSDEVHAHPFYQLPLSDREKKIIKTIITTMANKNIFQLAFEKREMEKKGKRINDVHPLRFVGYIFSSPELKSCMRTIKKSSFKWDGFMDGLSRRMRQESSNDNLMPYVSDFAEHVGADPKVVSHYIEKKDWEGLVKSLL